MILLNPGPANTTKTVKDALVVDDICPREKDFGDLMFRVRDDITRVVTDNRDYTSVLFGGSGTAAVEASISSIPADGRLLVVENGSYGQRIADIAESYLIDHLVAPFGVGVFPEPEAIVDILEKESDKKSFTHLAIIHHETSTGMLNPVNEVGALCREYNLSMIVDAMSSYAGLAIDIEEMNADYLISSSNKCIQGMAGLSFVITKRSLLETMAIPKGRSLYLNLAKQHQFFEQKGQMRYTPPVQIVYALDQALKEYFAEDNGKARHQRYRKNFETLDQGMVKRGFHRLLDEKYLSGILTAYVEPDHPNYSFDVFHDRLYDKGFTIYPGKGAKLDTFRLANMGAVDHQDMQRFLVALDQTLQEMNVDRLYSQ